MYGEIVTRLRYKPAEIQNNVLTINGTKASLSINPPEIPFPVLSEYEYCTIFLESFENNKDTLYEVKYEIHYKWNDLLYKIGEVTSINGKAEFPRLIKGMSYYVTAIPLDGKYQSKQVRITLDEYDIRQEPVAITTYENSDYKNYDHYLILKNIFGDANVYLEGNPDYISLDRNDKNLRVYLNKDATERASEFDLIIEDYRIEDIIIYRKKILVNDGFSTPYDISIEFTDSNAAIFKWSIDGIYEINKFYISDNIINKGNPIDVIGTSTYIITNYDISKTQYLWLSSLRDGKEKFSDPITIDAFDKSINPLVGPDIINYSMQSNNDLVVNLTHGSSNVDNYSVYLEENEITSIDGLTPIATSTSKNIVIPNFDVYNNYDKTLKLVASTNKYNHSYMGNNKDLYVAYDWTPLDLPHEIVFTSSDDVVVNSSNLVEQMTDIGAGNRSFTQGNQAMCPAFIEYGNFNAIRFDGINDFLGSIAANNFLAGKNCAWIFTVFKASSAKPQGVVGTRSANNGSGRFNIYAGTGQYPTKIGMLTRSTDGGTASLTYNTEDATDNFRMVLGYRDYTQTSQKVVIDAANSYTTTTPTGVITSTQATAPAVIGAETNGPLSPFNGDVCCVIIGTNPLTTQEQDKIFGWAAHKYGLTDNLPSDHPYKTRRPVIDHTPYNLTAEFKND